MILLIIVALPAGVANAARPGLNPAFGKAASMPISGRLRSLVATTIPSVAGPVTGELIGPAWTASLRSHGRPGAAASSARS